MLYKNGINLNSGLGKYLADTKSVTIYCPYIKLDAFAELVDHLPHLKSVYVRWETKDLILGSSDLELYPYLKSKGIALYRNPRIHLKAYVDSYQTCFLTTANISNRALNLSNLEFYNYEAGVVIENLEFDDKLYFNIIERESLLITDHIYEQIIGQLPVKKSQFPDEPDFDLKIENPDKNFLISALPMTYSVETLFRIYEDKDGVNETELNCALHDIATYKIPLGLPLQKFKEQLRIAFFEHPFIKSFLEMVDSEGQIFFGSAKQWIHNNCTDVPLPRRWEITENIQILYRWIVKLSDGKYKVDIPGNRSERLYLGNNF